MKRSTAAFTVLLALAVCATAQATVPITALLQAQPAPTLEEEAKFSAQLMVFGPGIREIANLVVPLGTGDDTKARYALAGLTRYVMRSGGEADRAVYAKVLLEALAAAKDVEVKTFFLHELQSCGKDDAVPAIAPLLADGALCEPAAQALQGIRTPAAGAALAAALPAAKGENRVTLVKACGFLRAEATAGEILKSVTDADATLRFASLYAAANLPVAEAADALKKATEAAAPLERAKATSFYLLFARRRAETGHKEQAAEICREVIRTRLAPDEANVRSAALQSLVAAAGEAALPDLLAAANSTEIELRVAALNLARLIPGEASTARWVKLMTESPDSAVRLDVLRMLAGRDNGSSLAPTSISQAAAPAVLALLHQSDPALRLAAVPVTVKVAGEAAIPHLIGVITGDPAVVGTVGSEDAAALSKAAIDALVSLPGDRPLAAAADALPAAKSPSARVALLGLLGRRAAHGQSSAILSATADVDPAVRLAALKAMQFAARPDDEDKLLAIAAKSVVEAEREAALHAAVAAAQWLPDPEHRADRIVAAMKGQKGSGRAMFLGLLPEVASRDALDVVVADAASADKDVKDSAIRALAAWPDAAAVAPLLATARAEQDVTLHVLALRGAVGLLKGATAMPVADRAKAYAQVLEAAKRPDEKKLALSALAGEHNKEALAVAAAAMNDPATKSDAAIAVVRIVLPSKDGKPGLRGREVKADLEKAIAIVADQRLKEQGEAYLKTQ